MAGSGNRQRQTRAGARSARHAGGVAAGPPASGFLGQEQEGDHRRRLHSRRRRERVSGRGLVAGAETHAARPRTGRRAERQGPRGGGQPVPRRERRRVCAVVAGGPAIPGRQIRRRVFGPRLDVVQRRCHSEGCGEVARGGGAIGGLRSADLAVGLGLM